MNEIEKFKLEEESWIKVSDAGDIAWYDMNNGQRRKTQWKSGYTAYYLDGYYHCLSGPAIVWHYSGQKTWWIYGKEFGQEQFERYLKLKMFW